MGSAEQPAGVGIKKEKKKKKNYLGLGASTGLAEVFSALKNIPGTWVG